MLLSLPPHIRTGDDTQRVFEETFQYMDVDTDRHIGYQEFLMFCTHIHPRYNYEEIQKISDGTRQADAKNESKPATSALVATKTATTRYSPQTRTRQTGSTDDDDDTEELKRRLQALEVEHAQKHVATAKALSAKDKELDELRILVRLLKSKDKEINDLRHDSTEVHHDTEVIEPKH